jgi:hypothetical protein
LPWCIALELTAGVLVDRERVDHPDGAGLPQSLEIVDDLAVEVGLREPEHEELYWSDRHVVSDPS